MGTRMFSSGVESEQHFQQCVNAGVDNVLASYWQFHDKNPTLVAKRKAAHPSMNFMIDSGAHTFITDVDKFLSWKLADFENYVQKYVDWIRANKKNVFCAVELDIEYCINRVIAKDENATLGTSIVEGWQKKYFRPLQEEGIDIIYVWHKERGMIGWEDMCQRYPYVGLPGEMSKRAEFHKFMSVAKKYTAKLHGFAATKQIDFRDIEWYSGDSITWKSAEMYGVLLDWEERGEKFKHIDDKTKRFPLREKFNRLGFDGDAIVNDTNYKEVTRYSLFSMATMERFYHKKYSKRVFYHELRLPHPEAVKEMTKADLDFYWGKLRVGELFAHANSHPRKRLIRSLSAVQHGMRDYLAKGEKYRDLLLPQFPSLVDPLTDDMLVFQRELSAYISPKVTVAMTRTLSEHFLDNDSAPKQRDQFLGLAIEDLVADPYDMPFSLEEVEKVDIEQQLLNEQSQHGTHIDNEKVRTLPDGTSPA